MSQGYQALTEKEKQTLRLVVRGYDAKSMATHLGLSVHTINERLRDARRKMSVSSSREAARLLSDTEGDPHSLADKPLGGAGTIRDMRQASLPQGNATTVRLAGVIGGAAIMSLLLATLALSPLSQMDAPPTALTRSPPAETAQASAAGESEIVGLARRWLALVDASRWNESWSATAQAFRDLNTSETWAAVSEDVRVPLGRVISRTAAGEESVPAPPSGYRMVKFRTSFENKPDATETLTFARDGAAWRVVGYIIS
jgi:DNA-binding CsgD family transcriptional regulator